MPFRPISPSPPLGIRGNNMHDPEKVRVFHQRNKTNRDTPSNQRRPVTQRNRCCRCLCCACCLPVWARYIVWFIIIAVIICIIVLAALLGTFKMPTVKVLGVTQAPGKDTVQVTHNGSEFDLAVGLIVNVNNPNVLPIRLKNIQATASLPTPADDEGSSGESYYMGSGYLASETVPKNTNYNFTFPFTVVYDYRSPASQAMLSTLLEECGLHGSDGTGSLSEEEDRSRITVSYIIRPFASVLFVTTHPTLTGSASFSCPFSSDSGLDLSTGLLGDLS